MRSIAQKLRTMAKAKDYRPLQSKRKAISALLPYAAGQERDGQPEVFDATIRAIRASRMLGFMWDRIRQSVIISLSGASPQAIVLALPHTAWYLGYRDWKSLVQQWAAATSVVAYTGEVAQSVVDMLLQFMADRDSLKYIAANKWTWLTKRPSLPPICRGRDVGTYTRTVKVARALKDIEVLKSYFLLIWSEWNDVLSDSPYYLLESPPTHDLSFSCPLSNSVSSSHPPNASNGVSCSFCLMRISIQEDFGGVGMGQHRADLLHHLDHVLAQLDRGLEYLEQHNPETNTDDPPRRKNQYQILRETLLETNTKAVSCTYHLPTILLRSLTPTSRVHAVSRATFMCTLPLPCL